MININITFIFYIIIAALTAKIINKLFISDFYDFIKNAISDRNEIIEKEYLNRVDLEKKELKMKNSSKEIVYRLKKIVNNEIKNKKIIIENTLDKNEKINYKKDFLDKKEIEIYKKIGESLFYNLNENLFNKINLKEKEINELEED